MADERVERVLDELRALEDPRMREVNARHGNDHGVNLTKLRAVAKTLKTDHALGRELWATGDTAARLVAILVSRPKEFSAADLDAMIREARAPKVVDWLVGSVVKKGPHADELRVAWVDDPDPVVAGAGWALTADAVAKRPHLLDLSATLDRIEAELVDAPAAEQWEMNSALAAIGIHHADLRARAMEIGERLGVLRDYPTPPNCTSPFAPLWIAEIVRRREAS